LTTPNRCFAIVAPGLEPLVAAELTALGIRGEVEPGGIGWAGSESSIALANLWLRTASRVVMRAAEFRARTFFELERYAKRIAWERFVMPGSRVEFRVTCKKSKLYHSDAVAQRLAESIKRRIPDVHVGAAAEGDEPEEATEVAGQPAQLFVVRVARDVCTVSADTSGELLHRRGYRLATAKAPLRETLAAAMIDAAAWTGTVHLIDPMCGAGTIPIEAAMRARRIPSGLRRTFAFTRWPEHDPARWSELRARAESQIRSSAGVRIVGADRDAGAIESARANAERAGVGADIEFVQRTLSETEAVGAGGLLLTNPPYGVRVSGSRDVRNLYATLGRVASALPGWQLGVLSGDAALDRQIGLPLDERFRASNGGIPVRFLLGQAAPGTPRDGSG
jgi:putative N6-adenine-specific DNA methylase